MSAAARVDADRLTEFAAAVYMGAGMPEADLRRIAKETGLESKLPLT